MASRNRLSDTALFLRAQLIGNPGTVRRYRVEDGVEQEVGVVTVTAGAEKPRCSFELGSDQRVGTLMEGGLKAMALELMDHVPTRGTGKKAAPVDRHFEGALLMQMLRAGTVDELYAQRHQRS